jgi:hypothetical protein
MKFVVDKTNRFQKRPHYLQNELDIECEEIITQHMKENCGKLILPIPTDELTKLIEKDAGDLDLYADLSEFKGEVQGVTSFFPNQKPSVRILKELSGGYSEHRLRTTLTHEYGHVKFHGPLWEAEFLCREKTGKESKDALHGCNREIISSFQINDWMEWQANYASGAFLMPITYVNQTTSNYFNRYRVYPPFKAYSSMADELVLKIAYAFDVSKDAAMIRLLKLGYLTN